MSISCDAPGSWFTPYSNATGHADGEHRGFGAGASALLLVAPEQLRLQPSGSAASGEASRSPPDPGIYVPKRQATSHRATWKLTGSFSDRLGGVRVEPGPGREFRRNLADRLDRASLMIHHLNRDECQI